ncbi:MAG: FAD-dependent monooxygenase [Paracoccaceae bacterium]
MLRSKRTERAVVIGGSIAGLLTARVLADHFDQVLVLERDRLPDTPTPRQTVPQEHHVHLLLQRGKIVMERLFPGLMKDLEKAGAIVVDLGLDVKCHQAGLWKKRWRSDNTAHYSTRTLLEYVLRQRLRDCANVDLQDQVAVDSVISEDGTIVGVVTDRITHGNSTVRADLVVDASGRGSKAANWLEGMGLGRPAHESIVTKLGYVSAIFGMPKDMSHDWRVLLCLPRLPDEKRMAVVSPVEKDQWMVTAGAWFDDRSDCTHEALAAYLKTLPIPDLYEAVAAAVPRSQPRRYRMLGGLRRRFDLMKHWPGQFLVVGDAVCSINPIYSQGMSASALQVEAFADGMRHHLSTQSMQKSICASVERPWQLAASVENRFDGTGPLPTPMDRLRNAYFDQLVKASAWDQTIALSLLRVNNLIADPATLTNVSMMARLVKSLIASPSRGVN